MRSFPSGNRYVLRGDSLISTHLRFGPWPCETSEPIGRSQVIPNKHICFSDFFIIERNSKNYKNRHNWCRWAICERFNRSMYCEQLLMAPLSSSLCLSLPAKPYRQHSNIFLKKEYMLKIFQFFSLSLRLVESFRCCYCCIGKGLLCHLISCVIAFLR